MNLNLASLITILICVVVLRKQATCHDARVLNKPRPLRLPNATVPLHYHWHVTTLVHLGDLSFKGNVTIDLEIKETTDEIVLHAKDLRNFGITCIDLETMQELTDLTHTHDYNNNFLIIHAREYYQVFEVMKKYRLEILYDGSMNEKHAGMYWLAYKDEQNNTIYHAATQFEPNWARMAFPCYDEPAFKANYTIKVTHGKIYNAISNMKEVSVIEHSDSDLATTTFATTPIMSSYLVAFVVSNFGFISQEYRNITQRLFTPPTSKNKGQKQLEYSVKTLAVIEDYLGIDYPLEKLDHIALNKNYGAAMENWGLITYQDKYLLFGESDSLQRVKNTVTIVHELAHQWFGNLVSPEWWSYAWLNEGFSTYFAFIFIDLLLPEYKSMEYFLIETADRAYSFNDFSTSPHPMTHYVETDHDIVVSFDTIAYAKSACVIRMFHHAFNQDTFKRGLQSFLKQYQYSVANEYQLAECMQKALEDDPMLCNEVWVKSLKDIVMSWTHTNWIPIVSIIRNYKDNTVTIKQRSKNPNSQEHWWIPLNFATSSTNNFSKTVVDYFMPPRQEITLNLADYGIELTLDDWLVVNKQQTGFYHVLYDVENLLLIAKALQKDHLIIHEFNRADLFQNLRSQIEHNEFSVEVILELFKYLTNEDNLLVWNFVTPMVELLETNLYGTAYHEPFKLFIQNIIGPIYQKVITETYSSGKMITDKLHRSILQIACLVDLPECLVYTRQLTYDYIFENLYIESDSSDYFHTRGIVLCSGLRYMEPNNFNYIIRMLESTDKNVVQYDDIMYNLRCTQIPEQIRFYLDMVFGPNNTQYISNETDGLNYVGFMYGTNMKSREIVWQYINDNYETLVRSVAFVDFFNRISEYVMTDKRSWYNELHGKILRALKAMGEEYSTGLIPSDSPDIGKKIKMCETFREKYGNDINEWLMHNPVKRTTQAASMVNVHNGAALSTGTALSLAGNLYKKLSSFIIF